MNDCCNTNKPVRKDIFFIATSVILVCLYISSFFVNFSISNSVRELTDKIWISIIIGIIFVGILSKMQRDVIMRLIGNGGKFSRIFRATLIGLMFDMCSHGVLMIGVKLYQKGATIGQVIAFLLTSPWNSISLTLIMINLIGTKLSFVFIIFSMVIGIITGLVFDYLVEKRELPKNPNKTDYGKIVGEIRKEKAKLNFLVDTIKTGILDSKIVIKWMIFGILLTAMIRFMIPDTKFAEYFGPNILGLFFTVAIASIVEICSEGSLPIGADFVNRANASGNSFTFLMRGASTDYTEIMTLKETTKSLKIALFLPLISLPQIILVGYILNSCKI